MMQAIRFPELDQIEVAEVSEPSAGAGEVVVRLKAAALNRRDLWIKQGQYAGLKFPLIPGSDGAGEIAAMGAGVEGVSPGDEVIINPSFDWGTDERAQAKSFSILGLPRDGTLAERIAVPAAQLAPKPAHLSWNEAAALPLAGLTAYRALFARAGLKAGEKVLISGVGGGVASFALQFAVAAGAQVWVTSSSADKIAEAVELGAEAGFDYRADGWAKAVAAELGGFDVVVDSAGGDGFGRLIDLCNPGARVVFFGATRGDPPVLPMRKVFWKQISLLGTTMGSPLDWHAMMAFVSQHGIRPVVSATFPLADAAAAFELMAAGEQSGKIVITI